jgi:hypothetical protein
MNAVCAARDREIEYVGQTLRHGLRIGQSEAAGDKRAGHGGIVDRSGVWP